MIKGASGSASGSDGLNGSGAMYHGVPGGPGVAVQGMVIP